MKLWLTRDSGGSIHAGGLDRVHVWMTEPCRIFRSRTHEDDMFPLHEDPIEKELGDKLLHRYKFSEQLPDRIIELYDQRLLSIEVSSFKPGRYTSHRPVKASIFFGFIDKGDGRDEVAEYIWDLICFSFNWEPFDTWSDLERQGKCPKHYQWCREIEIEVGLKK
jgi:hypothetical protein